MGHGGAQRGVGLFKMSGDLGHLGQMNPDRGSARTEAWPESSGDEAVATFQEKIEKAIQFLCLLVCHRD